MGKDKRSALDHVMHYIERKSEFGKCDTISVANAKRAAQYAYDAGKQSVIDNMELSWTGGYYTSTLFNIDYTIVYSPVSKRCFLQFGEEFLDGDYSSKDAAKQAANEDYKNRIKQALGL